MGPGADEGEDGEKTRRKRMMSKITTATPSATYGQFVSTTLIAVEEVEEEGKDVGEVEEGKDEDVGEDVVPEGRSDGSGVTVDSNNWHFDKYACWSSAVCNGAFVVMSTCCEQHNTPSSAPICTGARVGSTGRVGRGC